MSDYYDYVSLGFNLEWLMESILYMMYWCEPFRFHDNWPYRIIHVMS